MNHIHISESCEITPHEILHDMFTQFLETSSRFAHADKAKGVKRLLFRHNILSIKYQHLTKQTTI